MSPWSRAFNPSLALTLVVGCASSGALDLVSARRRPDGVAIDPISAPPPARDHASVGDGLVTLRAPLGADRAIALVEELFRKVVVKDGEGLVSIFASGASMIAPSAQPGAPNNALLFWQSRFRKLDYTRLAGEPIYREAELSVFRAEDSPDTIPHPSIHPEALAEGDVVVRVPIITTRVGADRFFGDEIVFWMRRDGDRFRIYRVLEDFQLN
jgi:hypothetical protein